MTIIEFRDFIFEIYYRKTEFPKRSNNYSIQHHNKDLQLFATKLTKEIPDPSHAEEHYQSFIRKKSIKSVKQSKIITQQPKNFENPSIHCWYKVSYYRTSKNFT